MNDGVRKLTKLPPSPPNSTFLQAEIYTMFDFLFINSGNRNDSEFTSSKKSNSNEQKTITIMSLNCRPPFFFWG